MTHADAARRLLRRCRSAGLATHSRHLPGYPYASTVPIMLDRAASPVTLVSRLAEHTKNLEADERASFVAQAPGADTQSSPRLTLLGACRRAEDRDQLAARYARYFPVAIELLRLDFDFYRITAAAVRYIGGFGSAHWLTAEAIAPPLIAPAAHEAGLIEQVDRRHAGALRACCRHAHAIDASAVHVAGIDCDGFDVLADDTLVRFEFPAPVLDADCLRSALDALLEAGRP